MLDRPDAAALLNAMAKTLSDEVLPTTSGGTRHSVRVVANLCRILEREVADGPGHAEKTREALVQLLGQEADLPELVTELDRRLQDADEGFEVLARDVLMQDVERRLTIDRPGYAS
jgi:hypothetical protein